MPITIKQTSAETLPTGGEYQASVIDIQEAEGQFGAQLSWLFVIQDGQHAGKTVRGWTSTSFSPKSKLWSWTKAIFEGKEIPPTYVWNSDHLIGRDCRLVLVEQARDDGSTFNKIMGLKPVNSPQMGIPGVVQQPDAPATRERDVIPF